MDIEVSAKYLGDRIVESTHLKGGSTVVTDAPADRGGKGLNFAPVELCATSLAACTMTTLGIYGKNNNVDVDGMEATIVKIMADNPRRIGRIDILITMPDKEYSPQQKDALESAARSCPVRMSLHPDMEKNVAFKWAR